MPSPIATALPLPLPSPCVSGRLQRGVGLLLVLIAGCSIACGKEKGPENPGKRGTEDALERRLDRWCRRTMAAHHMSGSVLVARGSQVLLRRGYGWADRGRRIPCRPGTRYLIASLSKQFVAAAVLLLQERGKLHPNQSVARFLPAFPNGKTITIHHLLTHSGGLANFTDDYFRRRWFYLGKRFSMDQVLTLFRDRPLRHEPGARFQYSNSHYVLLGRIVERVSGMGCEAFLKQEFFQPLAMRATAFDYLERGRRRARPYGIGRRGKRFLCRHNHSLLSVAGGLTSTVDDLHRWLTALIRGRVLKRSSLRRAWTVHQDVYGYGWRITRQQVGRRSLRCIWHTGTLPGWKSVLAYFPALDLRVIILGNGSSLFRLKDLPRQVATLVSVGEKGGTVPGASRLRLICNHTE